MVNYKENIISKLGKRTFVKFENRDELGKINVLLYHLGYRNYCSRYCSFRDFPKVLVLDNEKLTVSTTNVTCAACACSAGKKFYNYDELKQIVQS